MVERNWRSRRGELDLVVRRPGEIVFCEVKTRTGQAYGMPFEAVTASKQARLRRLAAEWLRAHPGASTAPSGGSGRSGRIPDVRFDVVSILGDRVEVIEGAF